MDIRPTTRAAFEALCAAGDVPSVRKMYARVGGAYTRLVQEMRALRAERDDGGPAVPLPLPDGGDPVATQAQWCGGTEATLVPLAVTAAAVTALGRLRQALRDNARLSHDVELFLWKLQRSKREPLTDALAAWVGKEN